MLPKKINCVYRDTVTAAVVSFHRTLRYIGRTALYEGNGDKFEYEIPSDSSRLVPQTEINIEEAL
jgi:hypothetical protein